MSNKPTYEDLQKRVQELKSVEIEREEAWKNLHESKKKLEKERSELKKFRDALKESERNLKRAQRVSKTGNWYYDWDSKTEIWSDECFNMYHVKKENYSGNVVPESLSEQVYKNPEKVQSLSTTLAMKHDTYELEFSTVPINGQVKIIHSYCEVEKDKNGNILKVFGTDQDITDRKQIEKERENLLQELQNKLSEVKELRGLIPICASCKKIRDDGGYWKQIESYIEKHSQAVFSHGMCPSCMETTYGSKEWYKKIENK